jgi:hypothetical protein
VLIHMHIVKTAVLSVKTSRNSVSRLPFRRRFDTILSPWHSTLSLQTEKIKSLNYSLTGETFLPLTKWTGSKSTYHLCIHFCNHQNTEKLMWIYKSNCLWYSFTNTGTVWLKHTVSWDQAYSTKLPIIIVKKFVIDIISF